MRAVIRGNIQRRNVYKMQGLRTAKAVEDAKNLLVVGENEDCRIYLLTEYLAKINESGIPFVLLHSNPRFTTIFNNGALQLPVVCIDNKNAIYDPFYKKDELSVGSVFKKLLRQDDDEVLLIVSLYSKLLKQMNIEISFNSLYEMNEMSVSKLTALAGKYEEIGLLRAKISDQTLRMKMQGAMMELKRQCPFLSTDSKLKTNIALALSKNSCLCLNMTGMDQSSLEELIGFEINTLINNRTKFCLALDEVMIDNETLYTCFDHGFPLKAIAARRMSSVLKSEEAMGKIINDFNRIIILKHNVTTDCEIFSKAIGTYQHIRESVGTGTNKTPLQIFKSHHVERTCTEEDRQRLKAEDITQLYEDGAFIYYSESSKIIETKIMF